MQVNSWECMHTVDATWLIEKVSRRKLLTTGFGLAGATVNASSAPCEGTGNVYSSAAALPSDDLPGVQDKKKLKVVFVGAHTDDWVICGGTIARYTRLGHEA